MQPPGIEAYPVMDGLLARLRRRAVAFGTVIDVGASDGRWSRKAARQFPHAAYHLLEAMALHEPGLRQFCREHDGALWQMDLLFEPAGAEVFKFRTWA